MTTRDLIAVLIAAGVLVGFVWYQRECDKRDAAKPASLSPSAPAQSLWWQGGTPEAATVVAPSGKSQWEQYGVLMPYFK